MNINERMQFCPIGNEAMSVTCQTNTLFFLPERKILFRCCVSQNLKSNHPPYIAKISACAKDTFDPEAFLAVNVYTGWGKAVPIQESQIPRDLAEKIQQVFLEEMEFNKNYPDLNPEAAQNAMCEIFAKMSPKDMEDEAKFDQIAKETLSKEMYDNLFNKEKEAKADDLNQKKLDLGLEFDQHAQANLGIHVSRF